jgi:hypothetical protein
MNNLRYVLVHKSILWNSIRVAMAYVFWGLVTTQALGQTNPNNCLVVRLKLTQIGTFQTLLKHWENIE